jgi:anti-sigma factor RsiW
MTGCGDWLTLLSGRLDDALPAEDRERTDAHVASCRDCRGRLDSLRALKHAVARLPGRESPPGAVRAHVEALALRGRPVFAGVARRSVLAACLAAGAWGIAALIGRQAPPDARLAAELAADHLHSVPEALPAEVVTDDPAEAVRFFADRVPFPPLAPRLPGARLVGGRLCKVQGRRVQLLFYRVSGDETVSLFVSDRDMGGAGCREARGLQVCSRRTAGLTLLAVSGGPPAGLRRLLDSATY